MAPVIVFTVFWLKPLVAAVVVSGLVMSMWPLIRRNLLARSPKIALGAAIVAIAMAVAWAILIGGNPIMGHMNWYDWAKHLGVMHDLVERPWPVAYFFERESSEPSMLRFYVAYYLVPAGLARMCGGEFAFPFLICWTLIGLAMVFGLLVSRWRTAVAAIILVGLFSILSGMDVIGFLLWGDQTLEWGSHLERWSRSGAVFHSNASHILFAPHHAIAGWLTGLVMCRLRNELQWIRRLPVVLAILPLWSPFVALGVVPFAALHWVSAVRREGIRPTISWPAVGVAVVSGALIAAYITSGTTSVPFGSVFRGPFATSVVHYFAFVLLEVVPFIVLLRLVHPAAFRDPEVSIALMVLLALPLVSVGLANDLCMRASIPALLVIFLSLGDGLVAMRERANRSVRWLSLSAAIAIFTVGAITPIQEVVRAVRLRGARGVPARSLIDRLDFRRLYIAAASDNHLHAAYREQRAVPTWRVWELPPADAWRPPGDLGILSRQDFYRRRGGTGDYQTISLASPRVDLNAGRYTLRFEIELRSDVPLDGVQIRVLAAGKVVRTPSRVIVARLDQPSGSPGRRTYVALEEIPDLIEDARLVLTLAGTKLQPRDVALRSVHADRLESE